MKNGAKVAIVLLLAVAVAATFALRGGKRAAYVEPHEPPAAAAPAAQSAPGAATQTSGQAPKQEVAAIVQAAPAGFVPNCSPGGAAAAAAPRLLELGSSRCQACLEMAKVLEALRASQGPKLRVDFIDVFERPAAADDYKIALIPTQILFDAAGKEIFRHQGYFSHDDVLAKFRELGVKL